MIRSVERKIYLIIMIALTVSGFIIISTAGQAVKRQRLAARISDIPIEMPAAACTVREYNGRIGVFRGNSGVPYRVIDYDFSLLSDYEREQLSEGVEMSTDEELRRFIEDIAT